MSRAKPEYDIKQTTLQGDEHLVGDVKHRTPITIDENYQFITKSKWKLFWSAVVSAIVKFFIWIYIHLVYSFRVEGKRNLTSVKSGCITIANHIHDIDSFMLASTCLTHRKAYTIAITQNFKIPVASRIIAAMGAWPIPNTLGGQKALYGAMEEAFSKGGIVHIMPEGAAWPFYNKLRPFKLGACKYAIKFNVPIVPLVFTFREGKITKRLKIKENVAEAMSQFCHTEMEKVIEREKSVNGLDLKLAYENYLMKNEQNNGN